MTKTTEEILSGIRKLLEEQDKPVSHYPDNLMDGWVIDGSGEVESADMCVRVYVVRCFDQGNWRATEAEAELEVKRRAVIQKMWAYGDDSGEHLLHLHNDEIRVTIGCNLILLPVQFATHEKAQACIDALGAEILDVLR